VNFQPFFRTQTVAIALLVAVASIAFAGCGGGGGGSSVGCLGYGGGGGGGGGGTGGSCSGNPNPSPTVDPQAQPVSLLLTGENPVNVSPYGMVLGYSNGMSPSSPSGSNVVNLTANQAVQFGNVEANGNGVAHTASSLGPWNGSSFPPNGPTSAQQNASPAGTAISTAGFSTGVLNPGRVSLVYNSGSAGMIVLGCFFHYNSNGMRTVVIVM